MSGLKKIYCGLLNRSHGRSTERVPLLNFVYIETSSKCNFGCVHCFRTIYDYGSKNKNMSLEVFKKIVDGLIPYRKYLIFKRLPALFLHGFGEPTLNPELTAMLSYARSSGKFKAIQFVSNLMVVEKEKYDEYFSNGLSRLFVSIDTLRQERVEATRKGSVMEKIIEVLGYLSKRYPGKITIITVLSEENRDEITAIHDFLSGLGIKEWNVQLIDSHSGSFGIDDDAVLAIKNGFTSKDADMKINFEESSLLKCRQPFDTLVVNARGNLVPCCSMTDDEKLGFGSIVESDLYDLIYSEKFRSFREEFDRGRPPVCEHCPYY